MVHQTPDGVVIRVFCQPGAARTEVAGVHGDALKVKVSAPAAAGKANAALLRFLASQLKIPPRNLELVAGHSSRNKRIAIKGLGRTQVMERLGFLSI